MTALNQKNLHGILAAITSVSKNFIVPKQGNWWNPQEANGARPNNWLAYGMQHKQSTLPFYHTADDGRTTGAAVQMESTINLQFVGPDSEDLAQSVALWYLRTDVKKEFAACGGSLLPGSADPTPSTFYQDGLNTVTAWNVSIRVLWYKVIETEQSKVLTINTGGQINVR